METEGSFHLVWHHLMCSMLCSEPKEWLIRSVYWVFYWESLFGGKLCTSLELLVMQVNLFEILFYVDHHQYSKIKSNKKKKLYYWCNHEKRLWNATFNDTSCKVFSSNNKKRYRCKRLPVTIHKSSFVKGIILSSNYSL